MWAGSRRPVRVLLVDDDPLFLELLAFVIRTEPGAEIVGEASDGVDGVELAQELRPDLVLMDLRMPRMDGFEATRRITATLDETRVLVVSTSSDPEDMARAREAGAAGYVMKDRAVAELPAELERLSATRPHPIRIWKSSPTRASRDCGDLVGSLRRLMLCEPALRHTT
jgi:DNA-binding NarL/FixJ family response regulator